MKEFLSKIEDMLSRALDPEETDAETSIDMLYEVLEMIEDKQRELNNATYDL